MTTPIITLNDSSDYDEYTEPINKSNLDTQIRSVDMGQILEGGTESEPESDTSARSGVGEQRTGPRKRRRGDGPSIQINKVIFGTIPKYSSERPDLEEIKNHMLGDFERLDGVGAVLAREQHKDKSWHIHVLFRLAGSRGRRRIKHGVLNKLFPRGVDGENRVGHWEIPRSTEAVDKYVKKDGDWIEWGQMDVLGDQRARSKKKKRIWSQ